jgi:hypothetical protein
MEESDDDDDDEDDVLKIIPSITTANKIDDKILVEVYPTIIPTAPVPAKTSTIARIIFTIEEMISILGKTLVFSEEITIERNKVVIIDDPVIIIVKMSKSKSTLKTP